jgi:hypothetical protein
MEALKALWMHLYTDGGVGGILNANFYRLRHLKHCRCIFIQMEALLMHIYPDGEHWRHCKCAFIQMDALEAL